MMTETCITGIMDHQMGDYLQVFGSLCKKTLPVHGLGLSLGLMDVKSDWHTNYEEKGLF